MATAITTPHLPNYFPAPSGGATADRKNIDFLLNPNFNTFETDTNAAEKAVGGGYSGSQWAGNVRSNMLDSERIKRFQLGHQMLEPYLQREFQAGEGAADRASALQRAIMEGNQAMERLTLSEAGQTARLSQEERAHMEQLAEQGRQAMQQLTLREAGDTSRQQTEIGGRLANTLLSGALSGGASLGGSRGPSQTTFAAGGGSLSPGDNWANHSNIFAAPGSPITGGMVGVNPTSPGYRSIGSNSIDRILRQYGLN